MVKFGVAKITLDDLLRAENKLKLDDLKERARALRDEDRIQWLRHRWQQELEAERSLAAPPDPPPEPTEWECKACHKRFSEWKRATEHRCPKAEELRAWEKRHTQQCGLMTPR